MTIIDLMVFFLPPFMYVYISVYMYECMYIIKLGLHYINSFLFYIFYCTLNHDSRIIVNIPQKPDI